jgi:prepilin-type N-terminal cleavage/methylation domain-containing protein
MNKQRDFTPLKINIPARKNGRLPERHVEGPRSAGSQTDIRKRDRSFLRKSRKGRLAAESLGRTGPVSRNFSKGAAFTLIELLVVIAIIALLMAILMPALNRVKKQAKAVACQTNLRQWALVFLIYMDENDGYFAYGDSSGRWRWVLQDQHRDRKLSVCCPEASNPDRHTGTFGAWGAESLDADYVAQQDYGSYGLNRWVYNRKQDQPQEGYFKTRNVQGTNQIPLFLDCSWYGAGPLDYDYPPEYEGHTESSTGHWRGDNMRRFCLNRHNAATNGAFLDFSVRRIGLKELWTLKWSRNFVTNNYWTKAGGVMPGDWPGWMSNFKDY